jgi:hypothetical protein
MSGDACYMFNCFSDKSAYVGEILKVTREREKVSTIIYFQNFFFTTIFEIQNDAHTSLALLFNEM